MTKEELYQEHLDEMFGINILEEYSEEEVERIVDRLLKCFPNNGKLYKYRSIEGEAFDNAYEGLEKGYLLYNLDNDNKITADIVSGIIIDERVLKNENAKKLMSLAKIRNWEVKVRKINRLGTKHVYEKLEKEVQ